MRPVFDTNILIDFLLRKEPAKAELARHPEARISIITWIEVMAGAKSEAERDHLRQFLTRFHVFNVDMDVAETAAMLRSCYRMRVPDAIIWATAKTWDAPLVTRNTRDFPADEPDIHVPYTL